MQLVRELEAGGLNFRQMMRKYDTLQRWVARYGKGSIGKMIRVETPEEINELKRLKERVRRLEAALADTNIDLALERQYTRLACKRAGIEDVAGFKKKAAGQLDTER